MAGGQKCLPRQDAVGSPPILLHHHETGGGLWLTRVALTASGYRLAECIAEGRGGRGSPKVAMATGGRQEPSDLKWI